MKVFKGICLGVEFTTFQVWGSKKGRGYCVHSFVCAKMKVCRIVSRAVTDVHLELISLKNLEVTDMIVIEKLQKVIHQNTVLDISSLKVGAGDIIALVGPVDSGKEILIEILTGRINPTAGEVRIAQVDPYSEREQLSRKMGVLFPENNFYTRLTVEGNLKFYGRLHRVIKGRVGEVLRQVGLADHAETKTEALSSGLARRLALGRALLHDPEVLLLADPFGKCDEGSITLISGVIRQLAADGTTILILAEEDESIDAVCDIVYQLDKGRIVDSYRPSEVQYSDMPFVIPAKQEGKVDLVDPSEIYYVMAQDDKTFLQTAEGQLPTQFTLTELEKRLARSGFFRAHRSYLVNLQHVKEVIPFTRDSYTLRLKDEDGTQIPLSKSAARELRELLGY
jgi:ABC-2 type transport system ATP-binding protein